MRIGIDARMLGPEQTGIGRYIEELLRALLIVDHTNDYVLFVRPQALPYIPFPLDRVKPVPVDIHWYGFREQMFLPKIFSRAQLDLLHVPHFNAPVFYRKRMIVTIHDVTHLFFPRKNRPFLKAAAFRLAFDRALHNARAIIAVSSYTKEAVLHHFDVEAGKISVIPEGVAAFSTPKDSRLRLAGLGIRMPFLLYVGVWREHKNLVGLLNAFAHLRDAVALQLQLVLVGREDPHYPEVRKTWERLGLGPYLVTPGFVDEATLTALYKEAELVVIPSFLEGFGLVGLEALQQGTPVVASNQAALPEVLQDAAVYFPPQDSYVMAEVIAKVLKDRRLRSTLVRRGKKVLAKYSWHKTARETLTIYNSILTGP